jgi:hypothetical protein
MSQVGWGAITSNFAGLVVMPVGKRFNCRDTFKTETIHLKKRQS